MSIPTLQDVNALKSSACEVGDWIQTAGFHVPGDGGGALYQVTDSDDEVPGNLTLNNGLYAVLYERTSVNYKQFGVIGDGENDDGVQIKQAHTYAQTHGIPTVNLSGEYWITRTNDIPILTNVSWGQTTFHIDERYNSVREPRFVVENDRPSEELALSDDLKASLLEQIKPGVQIIPELAEYAGCLITVLDDEDRIGIRAGNYSKAGWAREELFYVEEEGRIIGDIAWSFTNFTTVKVTPCSESYLTVEGGRFFFSGHTPETETRSYHHHGIAINRSRTIVREQWMGLERGNSDDAMVPRRGFYVFNNVYDVTLENIRAMPWEKNRMPKERELWAGTYGIGGARMLNCVFRNLTAEAGWVSWGVFGTNLNKNFRVENCHLNRIDVHFHCWNLYIRDCEIGFKGISITGGGDLVIENTTRHGNSFVNFRYDYAARWEGNVRLTGCKLRPTGEGKVAILSYRLEDFDYQYQVGFGRQITIENLDIDFAAVPESDAPCWLIDTVEFSKFEHGDRLFYPGKIDFRDITVSGRDLGVRLLRIPEPHNYDQGKDSDYDGVGLRPNCTIVCDCVDLEAIVPSSPSNAEDAHLVIGDGTAQTLADSRALIPRIRFTDCDNVCVNLTEATAAATFERCSINTVQASNLKGDLRFNDCVFRPNLEQLTERSYLVTSELGTHFTNCTMLAPIISGTSEPDAIDHLGILEINRTLNHYHLNTALGNDVLRHLEAAGVVVSPEFVAKLRSHHALED